MYRPTERCTERPTDGVIYRPTGRCTDRRDDVPADGMMYRPTENIPAKEQCTDRRNDAPTYETTCRTGYRPTERWIDRGNKVTIDRRGNVPLDGTVNSVPQFDETRQVGILERTLDQNKGKYPGVDGNTPATTARPESR